MASHGLMISDRSINFNCIFFCIEHGVKCEYTGILIVNMILRIFDFIYLWTLAWDVWKLTAEDDVVISTSRASEGAGTSVLGIAVGLWALPLEEFRIVRGRAAVEVGACAAVLRRIESSTSTLASLGYFQFWRADGIYVAGACYFFAIRVGERDIEAINERDIIEV